MNINFETISIKNFLCFRNTVFDFSQFGNKTILISGENLDIVGAKNGCGKTNLFSAILFCVYGECLNSVKGQHISNWNSSPKDDTIVSLQISTDNSKYVITRSLIGKKKSSELRVFRVPYNYCIDKKCAHIVTDTSCCSMEQCMSRCVKFKSTEEFEPMEITRSTISETQKLIETEIVPCGKEGFLRCIFLTADQNYNFFKISKSAKNEFFESLFELTAYSEMYAKLHRNTLDENNTIVAYSRTIDQLNSNISKLRAERDAAEKNQDDIKEAEESVAAAKKSLEDFISVNNINVDSNYKIIFDENEEYDRIVKEGKTLSDRIKRGKEVIASIDSEIKSLNNKINSIDYEIISDKQKIKDLQRSNEFKQRSIDGQSNITSILCDDCLPKYKNAMKLDELEIEIDENDKLIVSLTNGIPFLEKRKPEIEKEISEKTETRDKYQSAIDKFNEKVIGLRAAVMDIKSKQTAKQNELDSYKSKVSNAEYQLKILKASKTKSFDLPIKTLTDNLNETKSKYEDSDELITHYKALEEVLKPENIRKNVVADMLKELNFRICGYLTKMGANYTCQFDEDFDPTFTSNKNKECEYNQFSSGERMRFSIACCLAFKDFMQVRLNIHSNILIIDEYVDSNLDSLSVNGIMDYIRYMVANENITAFVISHRTEVMDSMSDGHILVRKQNDESELIVEFNKGEM